jgi:uncharacterized membrane protein HdeD (DUF308 family)
VIRKMVLNMDFEKTSLLTSIAIIYGLVFFFNFVSKIDILTYWLTAILGFTGVLLIIGLSIKMDEQEKKRKKENWTTSVALEKLKIELEELKNP